ncbi:DUF2244 domain-containing protein [soil metagenome]
MNSGNATVSGDEPVFAAVLRPHRSLSPRGFGILMAAIVACSFTIGLAFWLMGAWPVVGFCGLDILLVQLAFRLNYRSGQAMERISLTPERLSVTRVSPRGVAVETGFNPYWARLEVDRHPEFGVTALRIASHGARLAIGSFLGPAEREKFAAAFSAALAKLRSASFS